MKRRSLPRGRAAKRPSIADKVELVLYLAEIYATSGREDLFRLALISDFGLKEGSEQFEDALKAFREMRYQKLVF